MKKLYRSKENRVASGLLGGLGEYFNMDPSVLRIAFIFLVVITGIFPFVIGYIVASLVVPMKEGEK